MLKSWKKLWAHVLKNVELITTILVINALIVIDLVNDVFSQKIILQIIVAAIIMQMIAQFRMRVRDADEDERNAREHYELINEIRESKLPVFVDNLSMEEFLKLITSSKSVLAWGSTFSTHIGFLRSGLHKALQQADFRIKFLFIEPNGSALRMAAFRSAYHNEEELNGFLETNLEVLTQLTKTPVNGSLDFRVIDYFAPYTMYAFDAHLPHGQIVLHLSKFRGDGVFDRPTIRIYRKDNPEAINEFVEQFNQLYEEAKSYRPL